MAVVKVEIEVDNAELMDAVFENLWVDSSPWLHEYSYGGYEEGMKVPVKYDLPGEPEGTGSGRADITVDNIAWSLSQLIASGQGHCFGHKITADLDEWDTCCADMTLQTALMGKVVYG
jgi:hypothetical protein